MEKKQEKKNSFLTFIKKKWGMIALIICILICVVVCGKIIAERHTTSVLKNEIYQKEQQSLLLDEKNEQLLDELESENFTDTMQQQARKEGYRSAGDILK